MLDVPCSAAVLGRRRACRQRTWRSDNESALRPNTGEVDGGFYGPLMVLIRDQLSAPACLRSGWVTGQA